MCLPQDSGGLARPLHWDGSSTVRLNSSFASTSLKGACFPQVSSPACGQAFHLLQRGRGVCSPTPLQVHAVHEVVCVMGVGRAGTAVPAKSTTDASKSTPNQHHQERRDAHTCREVHTVQPYCPSSTALLLPHHSLTEPAPQPYSENILEGGGLHMNSLHFNPAPILLSDQHLVTS